MDGDCLRAVSEPETGVDDAPAIPIRQHPAAGCDAGPGPLPAALGSSAAMSTNTLRRIQSLREYDVTDEAIDLTPEAVDDLLGAKPAPPAATPARSGGSDVPPPAVTSELPRTELSRAARGLALGLLLSGGIWLVVLGLLDVL